MKHVKYAGLIIVFFLTASLFFILGFSSRETIDFNMLNEHEQDISLFIRAYNLIHQDYAFSIDSNRELMYGAIAGMFDALGDPHSRFFNPDEAKQFLNDTTGKFEGVGMEVGVRDEEIKVISPLTDSPAEKAGLRPGDVIIKIEDESTKKMTIEQAVSLIRGPQGTEVKITVDRNNQEMVFTVVRDVIDVPILSTNIINDNILHIELYHFSPQAVDGFREIIDNLDSSKVDRIILDLRNNPGGYLETAQNLAGLFLRSGDIVVIEQSTSKQKNGMIKEAANAFWGLFNEREEENEFYLREYKTSGNAELFNYPIVVLINEGSASASEILAAALRDNREVQLIGTTSFGKGTVQRLESMVDGSAIKLTVSKWLTPKQKTIHEIGLQPDVVVDMTEDDYNNGKDPQLDKAIEVISNIR